MLKLKRVEIQGFKSFCDRTEMKFHGEGVAAIVGPNGCGKSNLSDAISWVLGEQSAKSLRGTRMEDVIFAGTRDRKPLGMAQVTMTLVDPHYAAPREGESPVVNLPGNLDVSALTEGEPGTGHANGHGSNGHANGQTNGHTNGHANGHANGQANGKSGAALPPTSPVHKPREITITRRLFRNGESEYLINGRSARLRDIQDLFLGSGLGPESYAIIEQGRIGQILSTKPADRRGVIEEAAGITKFKTKRRLAEAKLEGAKQNLNRVFDILEEVGRQVNSLKRQAQKAVRFKELRSDYIAQLKLALAGRYQILERDAAKAAAEFDQASREFDQILAEVAAAEAQHAVVRQQSTATETQLAEARKRLNEARLEAERTRGRLENQTRQVADIEARLIQCEAETAEVETRLAERVRELTATGEMVAQLAAESLERRAQLETKNRERHAGQQSLQERERAVEASRQGVIRILGEASSLRNQLAQTESQLAAIVRDVERIQRDEQAATADLTRMGEAREALTGKIAARQQVLEAVQTERKSVELSLGERRAQFAQLRQTVDREKTELSRIRARRDSLDGILSHRAYTTESVKRLFTAIGHGKASGLKPMGVLADFVEVDPQYEKAAEEFLHEELEYVIVEGFSDAQRGIEIMRSELDGRATFLVHPPPHSELRRGQISEPPVGPDTDIVARLSDVLKMTNGLTHAPAELLPRVSRCFLARDAAAAQRLALDYPDVYFLLPDGVCYHGYAVSGGKKSSSGPLALKRELRELMALEKTRQGEHEQSVKRLQEIEVEIAALAESQERLRVQQQTQEKDALALDHESRKLNEELQRANSRLNVARNELVRLEKDRSRAAQLETERRAQIAAKESDKAAAEAAAEAARVELSARQQELAQLAEEHSALRAALASIEERHRNAQSNQQRLEAQVRELTGRRANLAAELERRALDRQRLLADNIGLEQRAGQLAADITAAEAASAEFAQAEGALKAQLAALEESLKISRAASREAQERRNQIEIHLVRRQSDLKHLDETCQNQLDAPVAEVAQAIEVTLDEVAVAETEDKARELNKRIEALGPVNAQAAEEFDEAQKRYDFLNTQRQDLLDSIRDTERAIQEIDVESKKRFQEAFEKINANFRQMFQTLFNGGLGEMRLTDQENAMESGIDIVAQPPGKKLQNVLLLSGGERAMTAMALLMAIFKYQPSPFCILDEVDAPLDEPNILRLTKLLREMSEQTQFIVITHAKRTMEASEVMYGVTMQEPGVSKLVSVKFKEAGRAVAA